VYEEKYDGWRIVALKHSDRGRLVSRTGRDHYGPVLRAR
jgi:ATP-dependent DNA ligase